MCLFVCLFFTGESRSSVQWNVQVVFVGNIFFDVRVKFVCAYTLPCTQTD